MEPQVKEKLAWFIQNMSEKHEDYGYDDPLELNIRENKKEKQEGKRWNRKFNEQLDNFLQKSLWHAKEKQMFLGHFLYEEEKKNRRKRQKGTF